MRNLYLEIKWALQRVRRGWDDTATWGLDSHFIAVVLPPLEELLHEKMQNDDKYQSYNKERFAVYFKTKELIGEYKRAQDWMDDDWDMRKEDEALKALAVYFAENIGYYWD